MLKLCVVFSDVKVTVVDVDVLAVKGFVPTNDDLVDVIVADVYSDVVVLLTTVP